jgi:hypothetical protein
VEHVVVLGIWRDLVDQDLQGKAQAMAMAMALSLVPASLVLREFWFWQTWGWEAIVGLTPTSTR